MTIKKPFSIATDLDGTLLKYDKTISKENIETLKELSKNKNFNLILITGRSIFQLTNVIKQIPKEVSKITLIGCNGAEISDIDLVEDKVDTIEIHPIENLHNNKILDQILKLSKGWVDITTIKNTFHFDSLDELINNYKFIANDYEDIVKVTFVAKKNIKNIPILDDPDFNYHIHSYKNKLIEITSSEGEKQKALEKTENRKNIKKEQVIVIGDGINDIKMLNEHENSYLVHNGSVWKQVNQSVVKRLHRNQKDNSLKEVVKMSNKDLSKILVI